jgi:hypothetical protein
MNRCVAALCGFLVAAGSAPALAAQIQGEYIEARTADVYTGPCFSNAEVFNVGDQAVLAWKVTEGSWDGVDLRGLAVAAAVRGTTTFSEDRPELARSILIVDQKADPEQRKALIAMAKTLGGERLARVTEVKDSVMSLTVEAHHEASAAEAHAKHGMPQAPLASFWAPGLAEIQTRPLDERDHLCGNEAVAYAPLSRGVDALPAYTLNHSYKGDGLNSRWSSPHSRSSFVGHFAQ